MSPSSLSSFGTVSRSQSRIRVCRAAAMAQHHRSRSRSLSPPNSRSRSLSRSRSRSRSPSLLRRDNDPPLDRNGEAKVAKKFDLSVPVCRDFTRGRCFRPQLECRYAHPPPTVAIDGDHVIVCYDSLRDRCTRGYSCRYFHPPPHLRMKLQEENGIQIARASVGYQVRPPDEKYNAHLLPSSLPVSGSVSQRTMSRPSIEVCRDFVRGRCARSAEECRFAHHNPGGDGDYAIVCQDHLRGKCQRDMCRYYHTPSHLRARIKDFPAGSVSIAVDRGGGGGGSLEGAYGFAGGSYEQKFYGQASGSSLYPISPLPPPPPPPPPLPPRLVHPLQASKDEEKLPVCRDFLRDRCARGSSCRFVHPKPHTQVVDNFVSVCRDFLRGKCNREHCRFYHPANGSSFKEENGASNAGFPETREKEQYEYSGPSSPDLEEQAAVI